MRRTYLLLALLLIGGSSVSAQTPATESLPAAAAKNVEVPIVYQSREYLGKGVTKAHLSSGLTVLVRENHAAPVATVRCFVRNTGSAYEGQALGMGLSHILEHLVAGGTTSKRSEDEIQEILDSMGGQTNAFTSTDVTAFFIDCPAEHAPQAIELIADEMQFAQIPQNEFDREMGVVQRELEMGEAERPRVLHQAMKSLLYTEHPIRHPTIGYLPVVRQVTRDQVYAFYKHRYVPQNLIFVVVGDVKADAVLEQVRENFKTFRRTTERGEVLPQEPAQVSPRSARLRMEGQTTHYSVGWPTVPLQHPDLYALDAASYLLAHGDSSRVALRLQVEKPLAIAVESNSYTPGFAPGWFDVTVECTPENLAACRKVIDEEVELLVKELVKPAELDKVKRQKAAEHVFGQQTVQEQADSLANGFLSTGDPLFDDHYVAGIQSVTAEQVRSVAQRYLVQNTRNTVVIDPLGKEDAKQGETSEDVESPVIRKQLPNGLTLLLKRHAVTPTVSIQAYANGGVLADTEKTSGLAALACEMMLRGTEKYDERQIAEYFDAIGGLIGVESQRNSCSLQCQILKDDLPTTLDYVQQILFHVQMNEGEFQETVQQQLAKLAARQANPQAEIVDFFTTQLPKTVPYSRTVLGTEKTLQALKLDECRQFQRRIFAPNNMVLAIFGDIDIDKLLPQLTQRFGAEPKRTDYVAPKFPEQHTAAVGKTAKLTRQRENTAMLLIGYPTVSMRDEKSRDAIDLLDALLTGGGGLGGRLFHELRGEQLVYYVFGIEMTGPAPGYFLFLAQTRPESLDDVSQRIQKAVDRIAKEGVPDAEFQLAKQKLLAAHAMKSTTPGQKAAQAALDELYGFGFDHDRTYRERIKAVTAADVQAIAARLFKNPTIVSSAPPVAGASK